MVCAYLVEAFAFAFTSASASNSAFIWARSATTQLPIVPFWICGFLKLTCKAANFRLKVCDRKFSPLLHCYTCTIHAKSYNSKHNSCVYWSCKSQGYNWKEGRYLAAIHFLLRLFPLTRHMYRWHTTAANENFSLPFFLQLLLLVFHLPPIPLSVLLPLLRFLFLFFPLFLFLFFFFFFLVNVLVRQCILHLFLSLLLYLSICLSVYHPQGSIYKPKYVPIACW